MLHQRKTYTFGTSKKNVSVTIQEEIKDSFGLYIWKSSELLSLYLADSENIVKDKEIGAGTALCGFTAAALGASKVILSDCEDYPDILLNCVETIGLNELNNVSVIPITWGIISPILHTLPIIDVVIGSDVFYDENDFEDILATVCYFMQRNPNLEFITAFQDRGNLRAAYIPLLLPMWNLQANAIESSSCSEWKKPFHLRIEQESTRTTTINDDNNITEPNSLVSIKESDIYPLTDARYEPIQLIRLTALNK